MKAKLRKRLAEAALLIAPGRRDDGSFIEPPAWVVAAVVGALVAFAVVKVAIE